MSQHQRDKRAYLNATPMQREVVRRLLCDVLACLRASYLSYQTSHWQVWQVIGGSFYGNHLLFARLYESVQKQVDELAEKLVGYLGREVVGLDHQIKHIAGYVVRWSQIDCHHKRGLQSEVELQQALKRAYEGIKQVNAMTLGLDDWIMATANAHEENEYLLQQALTPVPGQKQASGAPTAEGYFFDNPEKKEVLEFAETGAISNSPEVAAAAAAELDISVAQAVTEAEESPPTPTEIASEPGGKSVSTLNRLVIDSEDWDADRAARVNRSRMALWLQEIDNG
jgi:DNA-binding ferritin-like protein